jgi:hypothetical protein
VRTLSGEAKEEEVPTHTGVDRICQKRFDDQSAQLKQLPIKFDIRG